MNRVDWGEAIILMVAVGKLQSWSEEDADRFWMAARERDGYAVGLHVETGKEPETDDFIATSGHARLDLAVDDALRQAALRWRTQ